MHAVDVTDDVLEHAADVLRADVDGVGAGERLCAPAATSSSLPRIEYSSSEPCAFTTNARPRRGADGAAQQDVVREHEVGRQQLAHGRRVRLDVRVALAPA